MNGQLNYNLAVADLINSMYNVYLYKMRKDKDLNASTLHFSIGAIFKNIIWMRPILALFCCQAKPREIKQFNKIKSSLEKNMQIANILKR